MITLRCSEIVVSLKWNFIRFMIRIIIIIMNLSCIKDSRFDVIMHHTNSCRAVPYSTVQYCSVMNLWCGILKSASYYPALHCTARHTRQPTGHDGASSCIIKRLSWPHHSTQHSVTRTTPHNTTQLTHHRITRPYNNTTQHNTHHRTTHNTTTRHDKT